MCYIAFFVFSNAILFRIMHWSGSSFMMVFGYLITIFAGALLLIHKLKENKTKIVSKTRNNSDDILDACKN
jgi:hypothetical protein